MKDPNTQEGFPFSNQYITGPTGEAVEIGMRGLPANLPGDDRIRERLDAFEGEKIPWRVNTPNVLHRLASEPKYKELRPAAEMIRSLLEAIVDRVKVLDDPQLLALVFRLTMDPSANPDSEHYHPASVARIVTGAAEEIAREKAASREPK